MGRWVYKTKLNIKYKGTRDRLSKPREPIGENLIGCLQRYAVPGYGRSPKHLFFNINNMALQIIPSKNRDNFLRRNRDIDISPVSKFCTFKFVDFNHTLGPVITRDAVKNTESDGSQ
jgi:hypothetical protein